jgi:hypothetical protein
VLGAKLNGAKFTPVGVPGAGLPLRATSVTGPEASDQMASSFVPSTPSPVSHPANAVWPALYH